ncbi:hypothetical protein BC829DRAFT_436297 [Chytridium lagenaria]|nr:hypothetical protein BC829DRAFT_436297 [Chytridium lagenaria]
MYALSFFIGLLALSAPISGLSISATRQELINNDALLADAASSIKSFASSLGSDDFTLDAATSMEFLSDVADFVSLGSQQISALQAHPFGLVSDDVRTNEVSSRLVRRGKNRDAGIRKAAGDAATKIREKTGITSAGVSKWAGRVKVAAGVASVIPGAAVVTGPVAAAAALTKALADRKNEENCRQCTSVMTFINSFASSLESDVLTVDTSTSLEHLSDIAEFLSLNFQQPLRNAEIRLDDLSSDISSKIQGLSADD